MLILHDPIAFQHKTAPGHPERPERLDAVMQAARRVSGAIIAAPDQFGWNNESRLLEAILAIHTPAYLARLREACEAGAPFIDSVDSSIGGPASYKAALAAATCSLAGAEAIARGETRRAFVAMRPPGHHCERDRSMGFCLLNNIAIAAEWLVRDGGLERVAIVDFDVHHGNGTQHIFEARSDILFISMHQHPRTFYPGTGYEWETGARASPASPGEGFTLNIPLAPGSGDEEALAACSRLVVPRIEEFQPEILLLSAGFDADARDPLASLNWTPDGFARLLDMLIDIAERTAGGRILSILEGGYDLDALSENVERHVAGLSR